MLGVLLQHCPVNIPVPSSMPCGLTESLTCCFTWMTSLPAWPVPLSDRIILMLWSEYTQTSVLWSTLKCHYPIPIAKWTPLPTGSHWMRMPQDITSELQGVAKADFIAKWVTCTWWKSSTLYGGCFSTARPSFATWSKPPWRPLSCIIGTSWMLKFKREKPSDWLTSWTGMVSAFSVRSIAWPLLIELFTNGNDLHFSCYFQSHWCQCTCAPQTSGTNRWASTDESSIWLAWLLHCEVHGLHQVHVLHCSNWTW